MAGHRKQTRPGENRRGEGGPASSGRRPAHARPAKPSSNRPRPAFATDDTPHDEKSPDDGPRDAARSGTPSATARPPLRTGDWARTLPLVPASPDIPEVRLRSVRRHPHLFRKLVDHVDPSARPGDLVRVLTPQGLVWGYGFYNPRSEIAVRMLRFANEPPDLPFWRGLLEQAVSLRHDVLKLPSVCNAYRVIHAEADGLPGLVADRYGSVLSLELYSLAMYQRAHELAPILASLLGTEHTIVQVAAQAHGQEGFQVEPQLSEGCPTRVTVEEHGTQFDVDFRTGHKTGFFCDQRENRRRLASFCEGKSVLDLCCYSAGFAIQAARLGNASQVTAVDLDEEAIVIARRNAQRNRVRVDCVHADIFGYMRDMLQQGRQYDIVNLDPPKLIRSRNEIEEGTRTHLDMNRLAMQLVRPGGLFVTSCCSGLLTAEEFFHVVQTAARQAGPRPAVAVTDHQSPAAASVTTPSGRRAQILDRTGAPPDHPLSTDCPETEYLKTFWLRVW